MARNNSSGYSGSLKLDKIVGIRPDKTTKLIPAKSLLKPDMSFPQTTKSMKTTEHTFRGKKY